MKSLRLIPVIVTILVASLAQGQAPVCKRQALPFPQVIDPPGASGPQATVFEVLRGDFHTHTPYSDGKVPPRDRVVEAWEYGYDVLAITDHGNFRSYEEALPLAKSLDLLLLRGMETGIADKEHLVALDFSAEYEPRNSHRWAETEGQETVYYRDQMRRLADAGAFILHAHPHVGLRDTMLWALDQNLLKGIEVKNGVVGKGWNTVESHGTWWYPSALDWAVEHQLAVFANSDSHEARNNPVQPVTLVLAKERSVAGVREAFEAGRTIAQFDGMLCASQRQLALLVGNLVEVRLQGSDADKRLLIENNGPVALEAAVTGIQEVPVALEPFQKVLLPLDNTPQSVDIEWKNLWIGSAENLKTSHNLTQAR